MFRATKPFKDKITGYPEEPSLRIGKKVPQNAVNLAFYYNPTATNAEKILTADPPRNTIDHRIESQWLTKTDVASGPDGEEPPIDTFPKSIMYTDDEGYTGRLLRQDNTVKWYPEYHVDQKEVSKDVTIKVDKKGSENKVIAYADSLGYKGNMYLDSVNYEVDKTRDVSEVSSIDYSVNNYEISYADIFKNRTTAINTTYLTKNDLNTWTMPPDPASKTSSGSKWPWRIQVTATGLKADGGDTRVINWINAQANTWDGANESMINSNGVFSSTKPVGYIYFDKIEYEPVGYEQQPTNGTKSSIKTIGPYVESHQWDVTDIVNEGSGSYRNILPTIDNITLGGNKTPTNWAYMAEYDDATGLYNYSQIDDFISNILPYFSGQAAQISAELQRAEQDNNDIAIWLTTLQFKVLDKSIDMLVDGDYPDFFNPEENEISPEDDPSEYTITIAYSYQISSKGKEGTVKYDVKACYKSITLDDGTSSLKRTITTHKEEAARYNAMCHYTGLVDKNWVDYDGIAFYMGSVTKGNSVGNQNVEEDNELLMFPDDDGNLRQIVEGIKETTDENGRSVYETEQRNYYKIEADSVYVTDVFKNNTACFYKYILRQPIYDYRGPDDDYFYSGNAIKIYTSTLKDVPAGYEHNIRLIPADYKEETVYDDYNNPSTIKIPKCYYAELYTSFISSSTDTFKAVYNGFDDTYNSNVNSMENGIEEDIYNYPFMYNGIDYKITSIDKKARLSVINIPNYKPLKDTRLRITFTWKIIATDSKNSQVVFESSERQSSILNKDYALPCEYKNFEGRGFIISPKLGGDANPASPADICLYDQSIKQKEDDSYQPIIETGHTNDFIYTVQITSINDNGSVNIKCNPDGSGFITAETTLDTGFYDTTRAAYIKKLDIESPYYTNGKYIYKGYKVKCIDSRNITVKAPRETRLLDSWYPLIQFGHHSRVLDQYGSHMKVAYSMPEYDTQHFSKKLGRPYVDIVNEEPTIINSHMIKTKCYPLHNVFPKLDKYTKTFQGKYYRVFLKTFTWKEAEEYCESVGGHLAMPKTKTTLNFIIKLAKEYALDGMWLGATNLNDTNEWRWIDGSLMEFTNWDTNEPNNANNNEHYLETYTITNNGKWNDLSDTATVQGFICEFDGNIKVRKVVDDEEFPLEIDNVSFSDGVILLKEAISENDKLLIDYTYLEEFYQYRGYWRDEGDFVRIDLNPNIYHTYNNPKFLPSLVSPSKNLFNKVIYFFMKPTAMYQMDDYFKNDYWNPNATKYIYVDATKKVKKTIMETVGQKQVPKEVEVEVPYKIKKEVPVDYDAKLVKEWSPCLYHKIDDSEPDEDIDIMIGSVYIRQNTSLYSTIVTDSRTRGGGVLKEMTDSLRYELEPESDYYLDIGYYDGKPYQENGVIIVRLDNRLLKEFGGRFTEGDIETRVKRWLGVGIYPIIEYVDTYRYNELPQYTLEVEDSYSNVSDITPEILLECEDI